MTLSATVSGPTNAPNPTGNVDFFDQTTGVDLGTAPLQVVNGVNQASLTTTTFALGNNNIVATYQGDVNYAQATGTTTETVFNTPSGTPNTETTPENTPYVFAAADFGFTEPTGSPPYTLLAVEVSTLPAIGKLTDNNSPVAVGQFVSVNDINAGLLAFNPALNGFGIPYDGFNFQVQDNSGALFGGDTDPIPKIMTINVLASTTTTLSASTTSPVLDQMVTLTAVVAGDPAATITPTGTITFLDGTTVLGTALLDGTATASLSVSTLSLGSHTITAVYSGDTNFNGSTSSPLSVVVGQLTPVMALNDAGGVFNGSPFAATATVAGVLVDVDDTSGSSLENVPLTLTYYDATGTALPGAPSAAGTYTVVASFAGSTDYAAASVTDTFTISQAAPNIALSDGGGAYTGSPSAATVTVAGVVPGVDDSPGNSLEGVTPTLTYYDATGTALPGAPSVPGTYTVVATLAGSTDYAAASNSATFTITLPTPVFNLSNNFSGTVTDIGGFQDGYALQFQVSNMQGPYYNYTAETSVSQDGKTLSFTIQFSDLPTSTQWVVSFTATDIFGSSSSALTTFST